MKKIIVLVSAFLLCVNLGGCGSTKASTSADVDATVAETTTNTTTTTTTKATTKATTRATTTATAIVTTIATTTEVPTEPPTEAPTEPTYSFEAFTVSGYGDSVTNISIPAELVVYEAFHYGERNFIVHYYDHSGSTEYLINKIGNFGGAQILDATRMDDSGEGMLEVQADGDWEITFYPLQQFVPNEIYGAFGGSGQYVTGVFEGDGNMVLNAAHNGSRNFIVHMYEYNEQADRDYIFNEIGAYSGQTVIQTDPGKLYFFNIDADGDWDLTFG